MTQKDTDGDLTDLVRKDKQAWEAFYLLWFGRLCATLIRMGVSRADAKDIAQETLVWACQDPAERCHAGKLYNYAKSRAIDQWRKYGRREVHFEVGVHGSSVDPTKLMDLREGLAQLSDEERKVIELTVYLGFTLTEAAEILKLPPGTVGRVRSQAKNKLAIYITGQERRRNTYTKSSEPAKPERG